MAVLTSSAKLDLYTASLKFSSSTRVVSLAKLIEVARSGGRAIERQHTDLSTHTLNLTPLDSRVYRGVTQRGSKNR